MGKVKILVACHKPATVFQDNVYTPIHVGKALSNYQMDMIGDNTGDNISEKNPMYCELTAEYWGWKNLDDVEYIGLSHYRRYFHTLIMDDNVDELLGNKYDIILPEPIIDRFSAGIRLLHGVCVEDIYIFLNVIKEKNTAYYTTAYEYLKHNKWIGFNMFVMKKTLFDEFAKWQFDLLQEIENHVKLSGYTRMKRLFGYLGEILLAVWCLHNKLQIRYEKVVNFPKANTPLPIWKNLIYRLYNNLAFSLQRENLYWLNSPSIVIGLKNDGICTDKGLLR